MSELRATRKELDINARLKKESEEEDRPDDPMCLSKITRACHGLVDQCKPGTIPSNVKKEIVRHAECDKVPPYPVGSRVRFHFRAIGKNDAVEYDDSRMYPKPMEIIFGKQFKVEIWEIALNTMIEGEIAKFLVPKEMCYLYPMISKVVRETRTDKSVPRTRSCCGHMVEGTGHPDLDLFMKTPKDLIFEFELLEVSLAGEYEMESWYMTDDEKIDSIPILQHAGNKLFQKCQFKGAGEKYFEAVCRIEQLLSKEAPGTPEKRDLEMKKVPLLTNYGLCLMKNEEYYEAMTHLNTALEIDPENVKGMFRRGQCYKSTGEFELARADFTKALEMDATLKKVVGEQMREMDYQERQTTEVEKQVYQKMFNGP